MNNGLRLSEVARHIGAQHLGLDAWFASVHTDSRRLASGDLFIALQGHSFDGHDYLAQVKDLGAAGALVSREVAIDLPQLLVEDTRKGLGRLAAYWRGVYGQRLIAVTGSNGKTTVKEMIRLILEERYPVLATKGNLNNDIGLPLTLLKLQGEPFAVVEMGANHPGEIAYLSGLAQPDLVVLNNVGAAHLEGFGNLAGVARAKGEIISGLSGDGLVILNGDDPWSGFWRQLAGDRQVLSFGLGVENQVRAVPNSLRTVWSENGFRTTFWLQSPFGEAEIQLTLAGRHNVLNALAAAAATLALGMTPEEVVHGLGRITPVPGRLQTKTALSGARVIDDTYNANPDSVGAAIDVLSSAPGVRWLVLGDLAELGPTGLELHRSLGERARQAGIQYLWSLGSASEAASIAFGSGGKHFFTREELIAALLADHGKDASILVKGSRSSRMELIVQPLLQGG